MSKERLTPELHVVDDGGTRAGVRGALEEVAEADLLVGPYGSDLVDEAARWAAERGRVLWNHGGSADEVERLPGVVSVPSPASRYLGPVLEALADSLGHGCSSPPGGGCSGQAPPWERAMPRTGWG